MIRSRIPSPIRLAAPILPTLLALLFTVLLSAPGVAKDEKKDKNDVAIGEVAGVVIDGAGQPIRNAEVRLVAQSDGSAAGMATTDKKGIFEIEVSLPVPPATDAGAEAEMPAPVAFGIEIESEGYAPFANELILTAGERLDIEVTMLDEAAGIRNQAINAYNEGVQLHAAGKLDEAAEKFRQAIEIDPSVAEPYLGLADVAVANLKPEEGVEAIETYMEMKPDEPGGQRLAYEIYRAVGRMDDAKALAANLGIEAADKDLAIRVFNEGAIASQKGDGAAALAKFQQAVSMDPTLAPAWAGIASIYFNERKLEEAVEPAKKAVELQPDHEQSLRIRFLILDGLGTPEAAEAWEAYRGVNQTAALELLYLRADLDFLNDSIGSAQAAAQRILTLDADFAKAHLLLGKILASTDVAKAKAHLKKFLELAPPDDPDRAFAEEMMGYL